jgi:hypothetical protein
MYEQNRLVIMAMSDIRQASIKLLIVGLGLLAFRDCDVFAEDKVNFELRADYFGKYIWRGQSLSDDPVFQPSVSANIRDTDAYGTDSDFFFAGVSFSKKF